jgi:hypothetical protein
LALSGAGLLLLAGCLLDTLPVALSALILKEG